VSDVDGDAGVSTRTHRRHTGRTLGQPHPRSPRVRPRVLPRLDRDGRRALGLDLRDLRRVDRREIDARPRKHLHAREVTDGRCARALASRPHEADDGEGLALASEPGEAREGQRDVRARPEYVEVLGGQRLALGSRAGLEPDNVAPVGNATVRDVAVDQSGATPSVVPFIREGNTGKEVAKSLLRDHAGEAREPGGDASEDHRNAAHHFTLVTRPVPVEGAGGGRGSGTRRASREGKKAGSH